MFKELLLKKTFFAKRLTLLKKKKELYTQTVSVDNKIAYQLNEFNNIWVKAQQHPFYKQWQQTYNLPSKINSLEELESFPTLSKAYIQQNQHLIFSHLSQYATLTTGGSTGQPTKLPFFMHESEVQYANTYLGRSWWDSAPLERFILIWGHSHLFGAGWRRPIKQIKRLLSDWGINTYRIDAYNLSENNLAKTLQSIETYLPTTLIGYTSSLTQLAKYALINASQPSSNLKVIIATSETVDIADKTIIEKAFQAPLAVEYGMAETGPIAYSSPRNEYLDIFWDSFIVQKNNEQLIITTLYDRAFPLIRYESGDSASIMVQNKSSILSLGHISGRSNDIITIMNNGIAIPVHSEIFTHILKSISEIESFKIIQNRTSLFITIQYVSNYPLTSLPTQFFNAITLEFPTIDSSLFLFEPVTFIPKTIAGKTKWIEIYDE